MYKITMTVVLVLAATGLFAQEVKANGAKGSYEQLQMKVLEIVEIVEDGFVFTGYYVEYKGKKIMVSSVLGGEASKVGDDISVMVQKMEIPGGDKVTKSFTFMVMPDMGKMTREIERKREKILQEVESDKASEKPAEPEPETKASKKEF